MENIIYLEQNVNTNIDLLEIAKDYCEFNLDKTAAVSSLMSLIEIVLQNQKWLINELDKLSLNR